MVPGIVVVSPVRRRQICRSGKQLWYRIIIQRMNCWRVIWSYQGRLIRGPWRLSGVNKKIERIEVGFHCKLKTIRAKESWTWRGKDLDSRDIPYFSSESSESSAPYVTSHIVVMTFWLDRLFTAIDWYDLIRFWRSVQLLKQSSSEFVISG
jgi:hypothetical protein